MSEANREQEVRANGDRDRFAPTPCADRAERLHAALERFETSTAAATVELPASR